MSASLAETCARISMASKGRCLVSVSSLTIIWLTYTYYQIHLLGLSPLVLTVPRSAPAARNRFLRLPTADGLTTIPTSLPSLLVSPLAKVLIPAVSRDALQRRGKGQRSQYVRTPSR